MAQALKRLVTGIDGLDALLKGGLIAGASYIIQGPPGAGKTILANQLACGHVRGGGRVLVATLLSESHERLFQYLSTLDFFDPALVGDKIQFVSAFDTLEQDGLDAVVRLLRQEIARQQASLLIVDGVLNARVRAETALDTKKFVSELQGHAAFAGCTVLLLTSARLDEGSPEHTMVDGVIELGEQLVGSRAVRHVQLRKTRGSGALTGLHECEINDDGLVVYPRLESLYGRPSAPDSADLALGRDPQIGHAHGIRAHFIVPELQLPRHHRGVLHRHRQRGVGRQILHEPGGPEDFPEFSGLVTVMRSQNNAPDL